MANRFLETNYYKSPFVRGLRGSIKGLYSFIICDCTPSGVWMKDMQAASMYIGFDVNDTDFFENFVDTGKAVDIGNGKFFFPDFIEHQYPKGLQENNSAHKNIIFELKKHDLLDEKNQIKRIKKKVTTPKPLYSPPDDPTKRTQGYGLGYGNGVGNGQGYGNGTGEEKNYIIPQMCEVWYTNFSAYTKDKENDSDGMKKILDFMLKQVLEKDYTKTEVQINVLNTLQLVADKISNESFWVNKPIKSIANNIQEFYNKIKNPLQKNGTGKSNTNLRKEVQTEFNKRYPGGK